MTIRYTCDGCGSVLKIKDEKAGTNGKCPKCKKEFLVPEPGGSEEDNDVLPASEEPATEEPAADLVDMPIELTPDAPEPEEFDPLAILGSGPAGGGRSSSSGRGDSSDRKPSLADMMKEFDASKKKEKKSSSETARPSAASAAYAAMETSGTAADALSKAYQQKRESASSPSKNAKDVKAAEERALLMEFLTRKAIPAVLGVVVLIYGYLTWMNKEPYLGPPLFEVSGQITKAGAPAAGIEISFEPIMTDMNDPRSMVRATSDPEGNFRLMYDASNYGAPAGEYNIGFASVSGLAITRSAGPLKLTVKENEPNVFKIEL